MRKSLFAVSMLAVTVAMAPACASKKFVRTEVGGVNQKVDTLSGTVEKTQERTRVNEERIGAGRYRRPKRPASPRRKSARTRPPTARWREPTRWAREANKAIATASTAVNTRVDTVETSMRRLIFTVTLSEDQGNFKFAKTELPDEAKARLDQLVTQLKADTKSNIFIEIEGHTDNTGSKELNEALGYDRAETVKRYLYEQHQIPLHKITVISYGEDKPVAPNNNRQGRAQNRRVVVKVLS